MFFKLEVFDRIIIHKVVALAFLLYEDLCRSWRVLLLLNDQKAWNIQRNFEAFKYNDIFTSN